VYAFQRGDLLPVAFQPAGQNQSYKVSIKGWTMDDLVALFDTTHTGHQGAGTARTAGKGDSSGNFTMSFDADLPPYLIPPVGQPGAGPSALQAQPNTTFLVKGVSGILLAFVTPTKALQKPMAIEKVNWKSAIDADLQFNLDWKENVNVGMSVYPTAPGA
jgi:hypothetical protein